MSGKRIGAEAIETKGWLRAHKWLILRRFSQLGILASFLLGPLAGIWIVNMGNLNYSYTLNLLPLTDPYVALQAAMTGHVPEKLGLIGSVIVLFFYFRRRACLLQLGSTPSIRSPTPQAGYATSSASRAVFTSRGTPVTGYLRHDLNRLGSNRRCALGVDQPGIDAASRPDFWPGHRVDHCCRHFHVRSVRDESRLVRSTPARWVLSTACLVAGRCCARRSPLRAACNDCMDQSVSSHKSSAPHSKARQKTWGR